MHAAHRFAGASAVITGAGSGIGRLIAEHIAAEGGNVAIWDINSDAAQRTANAINQSPTTHGQAVAFAVDITDNTAVQQAARDTIAALGKVNILINNAGIVSGADFEQLTEQQIRRTFAVNTLSLYWTNKALLPELSRHHRAVSVTVASAAGLVATARQTDYAASKFAAVGFTNALRSELKKTHSSVRTLVVCPYYIDTGMFAGVTTRFPQLLPILKPEYVADRIIDAIAKSHERLILPPFAAVATVVAALPPELSDPIYALFGLNDCMDAFVGRSGQSQRSSHASADNH